MATAPFAVFVAATLIILAVFVRRAARGGRSSIMAESIACGCSSSCRLAVLLLLFFTLRRLPYPVEACTPDRVVNAVGKQYAWSLTDGPGPDACLGIEISLRSST